MEEERRLAYVGITRAKEKLYLINARQRMLYGTTNRNMQSRFVGEIPSYVIEDKTVSVSRGYTSSSEYLSHFGTPAKPAKYSRSTPIPQGEARKTSSASHSFGQVNSQKNTQGASYNIGDTVRHSAFGTGLIISAQPMGNDTLLEIAFDKVGTKKLMANYAKLKKM